MIRIRQRILTKLPLLLRPLSTAASSNSGQPAAPPPAVAASEEDGVLSREEAYRRVHDLDFMTAVKILVTTPPKRKQFGLDFHLVQLFFACLPSLAVYLVAQYARYEIRRMEAEADLKKKQAEEEEAKAKEAELSSAEDLPGVKDLSKVIVRLDALEEVVKEIVDEKKRTVSESKKDQGTEKNSDPQVKSTAGEPKTDSNKDKSSSFGGVLSDQKSKGIDR